jgi:hypothetical protein
MKRRRDGLSKGPITGNLPVLQLKRTFARSISLTDSGIYKEIPSCSETGNPSMQNRE